MRGVSRELLFGGGSRVIMGMSLGLGLNVLHPLLCWSCGGFSSVTDVAKTCLPQSVDCGDAIRILSTVARELTGAGPPDAQASQSRTTSGHTRQWWSSGLSTVPAPLHLHLIPS